MNVTSIKGLVWTAVITQVGVLASTWITHELKQEKTEEVAQKTELVAIKAEEVKMALAADSKVKGEKLEQIHVLVNSRLTQALNKIQNLEDKLGIPRSEPELPNQ